MKKSLIIFGILCLLLSLCACGETPAESGGEGLDIVCTLFPAYDFAREIAGDDPMVRIVTLWNGGAKYLADRDSCRRITYESQNSPFYPGAAEMLAEAARELL